MNIKVATSYDMARFQNYTVATPAKPGTRNQER